MFVPLICLKVKYIKYVFVMYTLVTCSKFQVAMSCHKALRTFDVLECIFSFLDLESLENVSKTCSFWEVAVVQSLLWKKLANNFASKSVEDFTILKQKGLNQSFDDKSEEESDHFEKLCKNFVHFKRN